MKNKKGELYSSKGKAEDELFSFIQLCREALGNIMVNMPKKGVFFLDKRLDI